MRHWHLRDTDGENEVFYSWEEAKDALEEAIKEEKRMKHRVTQLGTGHWAVEYPDKLAYSIWVAGCERNC